MIDVRQTADRPARPAEDIDGLLRRFFRSAMPEPWPAPPPLTACAAPPEGRIIPLAEAPRRWFRNPSRFALVAGVLFFLVGYLALTSAFPRPDARPTPIRGIIGSKIQVGPQPALKKLNQRVEQLPLERVPLGNGRQAEITGHRIQGDQPAIILHLKQVK